jgi:two-component sensor histidine kinase
MTGTAAAGPEQPGRSEKAIAWVVTVCAATTLAIAIAASLAWVFHMEWLARIAPGMFAFKMNSAVGFGAAGGALLLSGRKEALAVALSGVPFVIGDITIAEYFGHYPRLIDQLLVNDWSHAPGLAGRSPPNTAAVLVLLGAAVPIHVYGRAGKTKDFVIRFIALAIVAVAMESLAGQISGSSFAVAWGTGQAMSYPAILSAASLGAALLAYSWPAGTGGSSTVPMWLPALICFAVVLFDAATPLQINAAICYIPLVLTAYWFRNGNVAIVFAAVSTALTIFGLFASPPGTVTIETAIFNRSMATCAIWIVAILVKFQMSARQKQLQQMALTAAANSDLTASLAQRDILLREVYHRVKNNMQMVDSLIVLQSHKFSDEQVKLSFFALRDRFYALGLVHHQLMASSDLRTFDIAPFISQLASHLVEETASSNIKIDVKSDAMSVGLDFAIPLGLLVTELMTNSIKHAFQDRAGRIEVNFAIDQTGKPVLTVADDGLGQNHHDPSARKVGSVGSTIIEALVSQLRGEMTVEGSRGTSTRIAFAAEGQS